MVYITVDDWQAKTALKDGQIDWLWSHQTALERWMSNKKMPQVDRAAIRKEIFESTNPHMAYFFWLYCYQEQTMNDEKKFRIIIDKFLGKTQNNPQTKKGQILLIMGQRGSGKTAFAYSLCDEIHKKYREEIWWFGPPCVLPPFIKNRTLDLKKIPRNVIVLFDEAGVQAYARTSMKTSQIQDTQKIPLIRQHDKSFIVITQDEALLDRNWLIQSSAIVFLSKTLFHFRRRRLVINEYMTYFMPSRKGELLYFDNSSILTLKFRLPIWWSDRYSKPYAPFENMAEMYRAMLSIMEDVGDNMEIIQQLSLRNADIDDFQVEFVKRIAISQGIDRLLAMPDEALTELLEQGYYDTTLNDISERKEKKIRYDFQMREMRRIEWEKEFERKPETKIASKINANPILLQEIKRAASGKNIICSIFGGTGEGKTMSSYSLSSVIQKIFLKKTDWDTIIEKTCFEDDQIGEAMKDAERGDIIIRDEQEKSVGPGSGAMSDKVKAFERTMRKRQINFVFNSPHLVHHEHHFILKTFGEDEKNRIYRLMLYTASEIPIGYITLRWIPEEIYTAYMKKNSEWLDLRQQDKTAGNEIKIQRIFDDQLYGLASSKTQRIARIREMFNTTSNHAWELHDLVELRKKARQISGA